MADEGLRFVQPRIKAKPKIRQVYWCDLWRDAMIPEIGKTRPVIVVSYKNNLTTPCLVVPVTTTPQGEEREGGPQFGDRWVHKLVIEGRTGWALCHMPVTVSPSRFSQFGGKIPSISKEDFNEVLARLQDWMPKPFA
jgi:mRNA interferase MazF